MVHNAWDTYSVIKQPPRAQPRIYQLLLKTHKLTIFITISPNATIASLKTEALSALSSDVNQVEDVPKVTNERAFEICRMRGKQSVQYEVLEASQTIEGTVTNWEVLFFQFRNQSGKSAVTASSTILPLVNACVPTNNKNDVYSLPRLNIGKLLPVHVTQPSLLDEDDEVPINKGKRKAPEEWNSCRCSFAFALSIAMIIDQSNDVWMLHIANVGV